MALEFARVHVIGRAAGHSAIKASSYRSGERLYDEKLGQVANYSHRADEVLHSEILLPDGADPSFSDRATLWNAVEVREDQHNRRASAQLAKDHIIALPKELNHAQHVELVRDFAQAEFVSKGVVVDLNIHGHSEGNPHAHLMVTTRALEGNRFGLKCRELNGGFYGGKKVRDAEMLKSRWADFQEAYFQKNELDIGVTRNNGDYQAELHLGAAHGMDQDGKASVLQQENDRRVAAREAAIVADPSIVIDRVASRKSVFSQHDLTREGSSVVRDAQMFAALKEKLSAHDSLIRLNPDQPDRQAKFTTQSVIDTQLMILGEAEQLSRADAIFSGIDATAVLSKNEMLSVEQRDAVHWVCGESRMASVVGLAGAGKSTTLGAARAVFESHGHEVRGIALAGKAAEELEKASGIASSTIHSWLYAVEDGREKIGRGDVVVMDEAGMVDNALMGRVISQVNQSGAKLVLVGDPEQLQPIQAGRPFRDLSQAHGYSEISTIRRQHEPWQRTATLNLARGNGDIALRDYAERGHVHAQATRSEAIEHVVNDYLGDMAKNGTSETHAVLAHSNAAVNAMNDQIRTGLIEQGHVRGSRVVALETKDAEGQITKRSMEIGIGERVLFTKNDAGIGVKNGTLGEVVDIDGGKLIVKPDDARPVSFDLAEYAHIKHGYAMTIHKSQGITVDRTSVLATPTLNKHLGYVAMSRQRSTANLYYGCDDFINEKSLAKRFTHVERAESVTDFALRHGVDLEAPAVAPVEDKALSYAIAEKTLETARLSALAQLNKAAKVKIDEAINQTRAAKDKVNAHQDKEPKTGLFSSKKKHNEWSNKLAVLTGEFKSTKRREMSLKQVVENKQEEYSRHARKVAHEQHPEAALVVKSFKAQKRADELFEKIESLQQAVAEHSPDANNRHRLASLQNQLDRTIGSLNRDETAKAKLNPEQAKKLDVVSKQAAREKLEREQSRGGHEL